MSKVLSSLSGIVSFLSDGSVDWDATIPAIRNAVESELNEARAHDGKISAALDKLYDASPIGSSYRTDMVVSTIAGELSAGNLSAMASLMPLVEAFIERSPRFQAKRGRSGGLSRVG
jgi:hypothetical protein